MQNSPRGPSTSPGKQQKRKREGDEFSSQSKDFIVDQLPSPSPTKLDKEALFDSRGPPTSDSIANLRSGNKLDSRGSQKRIRLFSDGAHAEGKLAWWLSTSPHEDCSQQRGSPGWIDDMSRPPSKRSRSSDTLGEGLSQSGDGSDTSLTQGQKYSLYRRANYPVVLETKGGYMRASDSGMVEQDLALCKTLLTRTQPIDNDPLFDLHFEKFHSNLRGRSEARICTDLHPRLVPSVENLFISGRTTFGALIEGYNDAWVKSIPFYGPRPQPDHTYGFKWTNFTEMQRRKLNIDPMQKSLYTAREDIYFPFLTAEVKCGRQGLDLAERPNMHSMTIAMRGIVDLYRRAGQQSKVHRRALGFTISHDDTTERIHAYYPEINGDETTYWRKVVKEFTIGDHDGEHRWMSYQFTLNVCEMFALPLMEQLKEVIDGLPDPASQSAALTASLEECSVQSSQEDTISSVRKQGGGGRLGAELRNTIQFLQQQLQSQEKRSENQLQELQKRSEEQQKRSEEQQKKLEDQLQEQQKRSEEQQKRSEEQQKRSEEQQKRSEQQLNELMDMLRERRK